MLPGASAPAPRRSRGGERRSPHGSDSHSCRHQAQARRRAFGRAQHSTRRGSPRGSRHHARNATNTRRYFRLPSVRGEPGEAEPTKYSGLFPSRRAAAPPARELTSGSPGRAGDADTSRPDRHCYPPVRQQVHVQLGRLVNLAARPQCSHSARWAEIPSGRPTKHMREEPCRGRHKVRRPSWQGKTVERHVLRRCATL